MGAPVGNKNATKNKPWTDALRRALLRYKDKDVKRGQALNKIAEVTVKEAVQGDSDAREEIAERLEGRTAVTLQGPGGGDLFGPLAEKAEALRKAWRNE